jgi:peptidoglycan/xylan/chitin deacetylase (PgdA/CDA1 family)
MCSLTSGAPMPLDRLWKMTITSEAPKNAVAITFDDGYETISS